jgi:hypothetical protein
MKNHSNIESPNNESVTPRVHGEAASFGERYARDRCQHLPGLGAIEYPTLDVLGIPEFLETLQEQAPLLDDVEEVTMLVRLADQGRNIVDVIGLDLAEVGATGMGLVSGREEAPRE